jgi:cytoskeleton-associated protein 5
MAAEAEDTEYLKLPVEDRCVHKLWKARVSGYEEAAKMFPRLDADDANAWRKFSPNIKKFVVDSNAVAQEKGLEATLLYVELCGSAGKLGSDITEGLVTKCLGAPKAKTKDLAKQIILMLCEIEVHEKVIEELIKGLAQKNPKVVQGCVSSMTECLKAFGVKVIKVSPLLKAVTPLLDNRDKGIRDDGKQLIVEAYRWVGDLMKQQLSGLKPVQLTELETEFEKIRSDAGRAKPERYLRSQMPTQQASGGDDQADGEEGAGPGDDAAEEERIDPYDLIDPVDIIEKIDKNFYEQIEEKKWQTRKEALDALLPLTKTPKIVPGDFGDLVRALKKVVSKDSNVIVVALAAQCLAGLAKGLRAGFKSYAPACLPVYLEKFKEKKTNVVSALVEAIDALFPVMNIEGVQEDCLAALKHKTPTVISETAKFLARCFLQCPPLLVSNKKVQKGYILALQETLSHPDATVREAASEALGVLFKFLGEQNVMKLIPDLDSIKLAKVKEFADKAELTGKPAAAQQPEPKAKVVKPSSAAGPKVVKPASAPAKKAPSASAAAAPAAAAPTAAEKKPARPATSARPGAAAASKKKVEETDTSPLFASNALKSQRFKEEAKLKVLRWQFSLPRQEFVDQLKDQMTTAGFNQTLMAQMFHSDFKQHLKAIEALSKFLSEDPAALVANLDLVLKWITLRFFETNPQVLLKSLDYLRDVFTMLSSESYSLHDTEASSFVPYLVNKVGDPKDQVRNSIKEIFRKLCQVHPAAKMSFYLMEGLKSKNAKQRSECLDELGYLIQNYGSNVLQPSPASCLKEIAKQIADRDNSVRNAALNCITETYFQVSSNYLQDYPTLHRFDILGW